MKNSININNCMEPKITNRFVVEFNEQHLNVDSYLIQDITMPSIDKEGWKNITITFLDIISPSTSGKMYKLIDEIGKNYKLNFSIKVLSPAGETIDIWVIESDEIISIDFGNLTYSDSDIKLISLTVKPSDCRYTSNA